MRSRHPSPVAAEDRDEHVLEGRRYREHGIEGDGGGGERHFHRGDTREKDPRPEMDPVPEEADGGGWERLPEGRGGPSRVPAPDLQEHPPEEGAHFLRRPCREELSVVKESDPVAPLRFVEI